MSYDREKRVFETQTKLTEDALWKEVYSIRDGISDLKRRAATNTIEHVMFRCKCHRAATATIGRSLNGLRIADCQFVGQRDRRVTAIAQFELTFANGRKMISETLPK